ncbi:hypothetical protein JCM10049v2_005860 [Rhodotorula toruloides]
MAEGRPVREKRRPSALLAYDSSPLSDADSAYDQDLSPPQHADPAPPPPPSAKRVARKSTSKGKAASGSPETSPAPPAPARRASTRRQSSGPAGAAVSPEPTPSKPKATSKARAPPKKRRIAKVRSESEDEGAAAPTLAAGLAGTAALPDALPLLPTASTSATEPSPRPSGAAAPPPVAGPPPTFDLHPTPSTSTDQALTGDRNVLTATVPGAPLVASPAETPVDTSNQLSSLPPVLPAVQQSLATTSGSPAVPEVTPVASQPPIPSGSTLTPLPSRPPSSLSAILAEPQAVTAPPVPSTQPSALEATLTVPPTTDVHPPSLATNEASAAPSLAAASLASLPPIPSPATLPSLSAAPFSTAPSPKPAESAPTPPPPAPASLPAPAAVPAKKEEPKAKSRARTAAAGGGSSGSTPVRKKPKLSSAAGDGPVADEGQAEEMLAQAAKGAVAPSAVGTPGGATPSTVKAGGSGLVAKGGALGRIPSIKKVGVAEQAKTQSSASTPKTGFNIMQFKQKKETPNTPKAAAPSTKRPTETKIVKESSTLMTHEQRRQEFLKRRDIERAERTAAEKDSLDLLEQIKGMQEFETAYRLQIRQLSESEKSRVKEDVRLMLPRLSTFGSVFSLFPRKA